MLKLSRRSAFAPATVPATVAALVAIAALAGACSNSSSPASSSKTKLSATELLQKAKQTLDTASSAHFQLTSSGVKTSSTDLVNGSGEIVRPDGLQGSFGVSVGGFISEVQVASRGGVFEAKLPFKTTFEKTNPSSFGLTNPATLLNPDTGVAKLLSIAQNPKLGSQERISGELLDTVSYDVPGSDVPVLPDKNPSQQVHLTAAVDPSSYQLRSITLVGPFTSATSDSTYVVTLTDYDAHVTITLPPTG